MPIHRKTDSFFLQSFFCIDIIEVPHKRIESEFKVYFYLSVKIHAPFRTLDSFSLRLCGSKWSHVFFGAWPGLSDHALFDSPKDIQEDPP